MFKSETQKRGIISRAIQRLFTNTPAFERTPVGECLEHRLMLANNSWAAFMFNALDENANPIADGTYRMVVDAAGDGVVDPSIDNSKTWTCDADDVVLDSGPITNGECYPFFTGVRPAGIDATDHIYLIWVNAPWGSDKPGASVAYAYEDLGAAGDSDKDFSFFPNGGNAGGGNGNPTGGHTHAGQADLTAISLDITPEPLRWGDVINWSAVIANQGTDKATNFNVRLYLSADSSITTSDYIANTGIDSALIATLQDGKTQSIGGTYTLPAAPPDGFSASGTFYFGILIDPENTVIELDETNNGNQGVGLDIDPVDFTLGQPNLKVTAFQITPSPLHWGDVIDWSATLINSGDTDSSAFDLSLFLSTDTTIDTTDYLSPDGFVLQSVQSLQAGHSVVLTGQYTLPNAPPTGFGVAGSYTFGILVDTQNNINESNESDNANQGVGIDKTTVEFQQGAPDLKVTALQVATGPFHWGDAIHWTATVLNNGNATADASNLRLFLSADSTLTSADYLSPTGFAGSSITALARGESIQVEGDYTLGLNPPDGFSAAGTFYFGAIADFDGAIAESNENNNSNQGVGTDIVQATFIAGQADLRVSAFSATPSTVRWGGVVQWSATISNEGNASVIASVLKLFLSIDGTIASTDYIANTGIASVAVPSLARGQSTVVNGSFTLPSTPPTGFGAGGTYTLGTIVDATNVVSESNENNNKNQPGIDVKPLVFLDWAYLANSVLNVSGTTANDTIKLELSGKNIKVTRGKLSKTFPLKSISSIIVDAGNGNDSVTVDSKITLLSTIQGGAGKDTLLGGSGNDEIHGGAGNDSIRGGKGNDIIHGDDGNDTLFGEAGLDSLYGGAGNDSIDGGTQNDLINGGAGKDTLLGGDGDDLFYADDSEADKILGGKGLDAAYWDIRDIVQQVESKRS